MHGLQVSEGGTRRLDKCLVFWTALAPGFSSGSQHVGRTYGLYGQSVVPDTANCVCHVMGNNLI